jgi:phage protein D
VTELVLSSTTPVFKVDGEAKGPLGRDVLRLEVEHTIEGLKTLTAHFIAIGAADAPEEQLLHLDGSDLDFGKQLEVSIGPPGDERIIFKGIVSALEADFDEGRPPRVVVFAEDALMKLRMTRRLKTYENVSDADIATQLAGEHGLSPETSADGPTYDVVQQWNMSDLAFLRDRARLVQAEVWVEDSKLCFKTRPNRTGTTLALVRGNQLISVRARADLAHQRSKVKVSGFDAKQRQQIEQEAGGDAISAEASGGVTGPSLLERALGERVSHRVREAPLLDAEATAWARAEMLRRARGFVTVTGTTSGTPDLVVGSRVTLERVGPPFEGGTYYVTRVLHTFDLTDGHRTHFDAERPTLTQGAA